MTTIVPTRPAPARPWSAALTFAWRSVLKIRHVPEQLGDVVGIPIIFTVMFTYLFGGAIAGSTRSYLTYLLPGTLVMSVLLTSVYSGVMVCTDRESGVTDRFRSLPMWRPAPIVGALLGDLVRYLIAAVLVVALGLALGDRPAGGVVGVVAGVALVIGFASALSWVFVVLGLLVRTPAAVMNIGMLVLFPLTFASNVFVDPATMPDWLRAAVRANPVSHLVTAIRDLMAGRPAGGSLVWVAVGAVILLAVFVPLAVRRYDR